MPMDETGQKTDCLRCGVELETHEDFATGICADCWNPSDEEEDYRCCKCEESFSWLAANHATEYFRDPEGAITYVKCPFCGSDQIEELLRYV